MPVSLSQLAAITASVALPVGENSLTLVYAPASVTDKVYALLNSFQGAQAGVSADVLASLNKTLTGGLIVSWDFFEDDAQQVLLPLAEETFSRLSVHLKVALLSAIVHGAE